MLRRQSLSFYRYLTTVSGISVMRAAMKALTGINKSVILPIQTLDILSVYLKLFLKTGIHSRKMLGTIVRITQTHREKSATSILL